MKLKGLKLKFKDIMKIIIFVEANENINPVIKKAVLTFLISDLTNKIYTISLKEYDKEQIKKQIYQN